MMTENPVPAPETAPSPRPTLGEISRQFRRPDYVGQFYQSLPRRIREEIDPSSARYNPKKSLFQMVISAAGRDNLAIRTATDAQLDRVATDFVRTLEQNGVRVTDPHIPVDVLARAYLETAPPEVLTPQGAREKAAVGYRKADQKVRDFDRKIMDLENKAVAAAKRKAEQGLAIAAKAGPAHHAAEGFLPPEKVQEIQQQYPQPPIQPRPAHPAPEAQPAAPSRVEQWTASAKGLAEQLRQSIRLRHRPAPPVAAEPAPAAAPELPRAPEASWIAGVGFAEDQGPRDAMEDAHVILPSEFGGRKDQSFFAVYDGHGGKAVADLAANRLHLNFLNELSAMGNPKLALRNAYLRTDEQLKTAGFADSTGSTAVTAFIQGDKLYIANAGDARGVLVRGNQAIRLTRDHKATDPQEQERIRRMGGSADGGYVNLPGVRYGVAVSRALGDLELKRVVSAEPDINEITLGPQDQYLILACDGVWDVLNDQEAADLIKNETDPQRAAEILKSAALAPWEYGLTGRRGSGDNITAIVVKITPPATPQVPEQQPPQKSPADTEIRRQAMQSELLLEVQKLAREQGISEEEALKLLT